MKKLNIVLLACLVLLFTCGIGLAGGFGYSTNTTGSSTGPTVQQVDSSPTVSVPEPASIFLLSVGLVGLAAGARKKRK